MDRIFFNGNIHTMNGNEVVSAVAVKGGSIIATGDDETILELQTVDTELIDLQRRTTLPGFNDSHLHILGTGLTARGVNLAGCKSVEDIIVKGKEFLENNPDLKIMPGRGWNQDNFTVPGFPVRKDLDKISKKIPIIFSRVCGHIAVVNTKALEYFGCKKLKEPPEGGSFDLNTGLFKETAIDLLNAKPLSKDEIKAVLKEVTADMAAYGITSAQSDDFGYAARQDVISAYRELAEASELSVRIYQQCLFGNIANVTEFLAEDHDLSAVEDFYRLGPIKLLSDGSLGARTAFMSRPYCDDPSTSGIACFTQKELDDIVRHCQRKERAVAIHCIGDGAMKRALKSIEKAQKKSAVKLRHGIVHCQISDEKILNKMQELAVVAYLQPIFLDYDLHIVEARVGKKLAGTSYAFKTMKNLGVNISMGSDSPVESYATMPNIYCAVTRKDLQGYPIEGYNPDEALSIDEAVRAYTSGSAYCSYEEDRKGKLLPGYYADMTVLDRDIFMDDPAKIKDIKVKMTIVGGKLVYWQK